MIDPFLEHSLLEYFDFVRFLVLAAVIYGAIYISKRQIKNKK